PSTSCGKCCSRRPSTPVCPPPTGPSGSPGTSSAKQLIPRRRAERPFVRGDGPRRLPLLSKQFHPPQPAHVRLHDRPPRSTVTPDGTGGGGNEVSTFPPGRERFVNGVAPGYSRKAERMLRAVAARPRYVLVP